jgi:hypothetical protein
MNTFVPDKRPRLSRHVRLHTDKVSGAPVLLLPETCADSFQRWHLLLFFLGLASLDLAAAGTIVFSAPNCLEVNAPRLC